MWGKYFKNGDKIRIQATVRDLKQGRDVPVSVDASNMNDVTAPVDQLADLIRQESGDFFGCAERVEGQFVPANLEIVPRR